MTGLLETRDCAVPGCPDEAHKGHLCDYHTANPARLPAPVGRGSHAHLLADKPERVKAASREPVRACKIDGCHKPVGSAGGPWKNYCKQHMSEEIARRQAVRYAKTKASSGSAPSSEAKKSEPRRQPTPAPPKKGHSSGTPAATKSLQPASPADAGAPEEGTLVSLAQRVEDTRRAATEALNAHYAAKDTLLAAVAALDAVA